MRIGQTSATVFASELVASLLGFIATLYFARVLGAEIYGFYSLTIVLVSWLKILGTLGISGGVIKRMSEENEQSAYASAGAIALTIFGISLSLLIFATSSLVDEYIGRSVTPFVVTLLLIGLGDSFVNSVLRGQHSVHIAGILTPVKIISRSLAQLSLVVVGLGLIGMLIGQAIGWFIAILLGAYFIQVKFKMPDSNNFKQIYEYAKYSWLGGFKGRTFNDVDILTLGFFVPTPLVGIYSIAWNIASFLTTFDGAVSQTIFPEISRLNAQDDPDAVSTLITNALRYSGLILIPGFVGALLLGDHILQVYGKEFRQGTAVLGLLVLATLLYAYQKQLITSLNAIDRPDLAFRINIVFVGFNIVANIVLIMMIGWVGAAIATALSAAIGAVLSFWTLQRQIDFKIPYEEMMRQTFAAISMGSVVYILQWIENYHSIINNNLVFVIILIISGAAIYFLILLTISKPFRETVNDNLPIDIQII